MAYDDFTLESIAQQFKLKLIDSHFCEFLSTIEPQVDFLSIFNQSFSLAQTSRTIKARSELSVSPILVEATRLTNEQVQIFSGEEFNVDRERGLDGFCDFLLNRSENPFTIDAPVLMLVKGGEIETELGQCVAQMVAAQVYNQSQEQSIPVIYGCVTSGKFWQFLKLEGNNVTIDLTTYSAIPIQKILGILKSMLSS